MAFSNQCITPKFKDRPHIVFMQGRWRVSPMRKANYIKRWKWDEAHTRVRELNEAIDRKEYERLAAIRLAYLITRQPKSELGKLL